MAVSVEVGTFVANTAGATTTVSTGFQGKAVILFTHGKTAEGESVIASFGFGLSDGTNDGNVGWSGDDGVTTTNNGRYAHATNALAILTDGEPTLGTGGSVTSVAFNATPNMVLTFNTTPASAWKISYILLGGADITNTFVGSGTIPTTAIAKSFTGVGFQGDALFIWGNRTTSDGGAIAGQSLFGFATSTSKRWGYAGVTRDAQVTDANVNAISQLNSNNIYVGLTTLAANDALGDFTAWGSDGFELTFSAVQGTAERFNYLVIKGGRWDCGVQAKPATATTQTVSSTSFTPKLLGYLLSSPTATASITSNQIETFGAATSTSARAYAGSYMEDIVTSGTVAKSSGSSVLISHEMNATANADFTSFQSNGWTITWDATGTAFQSAWFVAGDNAAPAAEFVATVSSAARATLTLGANVEFDASVTGSATATGALTTSITMAASASGVATGAGALTTSILLAGQPIQGSATAVGDLTTTVLLAAEVDGTATVTGALTTSITMVGTASGTATAEAVLTVAGSMDASISATATATGSLTTYVVFVASATGTATATATLTSTGTGGSILPGSQSGFISISELARLSKL